MWLVTPYQSFRNLVKKLRNSLLPVRRYAISIKGVEEPLHFVFFGWDSKLRNYWVDRLSGGTVRELGKRFIRSKRLDAYITRFPELPDLAIVQGDGIVYSPGNYPHTCLLPRWMELEISTDPSSNRLREKEIRRRIRKHALEFEIRTLEEDLELFYHRMYRPLLGSRHSGAAEYASYELLLGKFRRGAELLFVIQQGIPIAGQLIEQVNGIPRIATFGVLEGKEEYVRMGVHSALYHHALFRFKDQGFAKIRCGSSMPVVLDGVTQFKVRMGAYPYLLDLPEREKYAFLPFGSGPALKHVLKENPLFCLSGNNLKMTWFIDTLLFENREEFFGYVKRIRVDQLEKMEFRCLSHPEKLSDWVKEAQIETAEIRVYEEVTG